MPTNKRCYFTNAVKKSSKVAREASSFFAFFGFIYGGKVERVYGKGMLDILIMSNDKICPFFQNFYISKISHFTTLDKIIRSRNNQCETLYNSKNCSFFHWLIIQPTWPRRTLAFFFLASGNKLFFPIQRKWENWLSSLSKNMVINWHENSEVVYYRVPWWATAVLSSSMFLFITRIDGLVFARAAFR